MGKVTLRKFSSRVGMVLTASVLVACGSDETGTTPATLAGSPAGAAGAVALPPAITAGSQAIGGAGSTAVPPTTSAGATALAGTGGVMPPAADGSGGGVPAAGGQLPCAVSRALATNCGNCHGASPQFGAPTSLVTHDDFVRASKTDPKLKNYELALERMTDTMRPMPPASAISLEDKKTITDWLSAGATAAPATQGTCEPTGNAVRDISYYKNGMTPREGETCYELQTHGGQTAGDTTPFMVKAGEFYEQFYFKVPWGADEVMTRFGAKYDNIKVLHHWLLFTSSKPASQIGTHEEVVGTTIGDSSQLIGGWAVGGDHVEFPADVGLELTQTGILNAQWHYYNQGGSPEPDSTKIQICTTKRANKKNIGSLTFLGTENFNGPFGMPAKVKSEFGGSCTNDSGAPITIFGFTPHMHKLGINMRAQIRRKNGTMEPVFDKPFDFESQITYIVPKPIVLEPGETIVSTCTFNNSTDASVPFGPSSDQEMCYNFTLSYPARALDNAAPSLIGALNVCW